jgi:hypothetical protein
MLWGEEDELNCFAEEGGRAPHGNFEFSTGSRKASLQHLAPVASVGAAAL